MFSADEEPDELTNQLFQISTNGNKAQNVLLNHHANSKSKKPKGNNQKTNNQIGFKNLAYSTA